MVSGADFSTCGKTVILGGGVALQCLPKTPILGGAALQRCDKCYQTSSGFSPPRYMSRLLL